MTDKAKQTTGSRRLARSGRSTAAERTVIYRGILIEPMIGKRSPIAQAIHDGLRIKAEQARGESAEA